MTLRSGKTTVFGGLTCEQQVSVAGFGPQRQKASLSFRGAIDAAEFDEVLILPSQAIAAADTVTLDLFAFTSLSGAVEGARVIALVVKATAAALGGLLRIMPGGADPLQWFFGSTADSITLTVPANGDCGISLKDGDYATVDLTARNLDLTNTGSVSITVSVMAIVKAGV